MEYHEVANIFPLMQGEEFDSLKQDIARNGLKEPIWTYNGQIIDGRNRYRACQEVGINPRFREWDGKGPLVAFVLSMNLHRRHLTSSQASACALEALPLLEAEARGRQATSGPGVYGGEPLRQIFDEAVERGRSDNQAADMFGTNRQYVSDMKKVRDVAPELIEEVKAGKLNVSEAKQVSTFDAEARQGIVEDVGAGVKPREAIRKARREEYEERKAAMTLPDDKYRVVYADPPWDYGNSGLDEYGHANRHYDTMSIAELCELPIREMVEDNAVLFLWVTSPMLEDSFRLINAWGFSYKTSFVWDKVRHNFGYYNSVRHELLLVATRGSCLPDNKKLYDSVVEVERTSKHSEKPKWFRERIDELYTSGKRIELFSRVKVDGWDMWGNEASD